MWILAFMTEKGGVCIGLFAFTNFLIILVEPYFM